MMPIPPCAQIAGSRKTSQTQRPQGANPGNNTATQGNSAAGQGKRSGNEKSLLLSSDDEFQ